MAVADTLYSSAKEQKCPAPTFVQTAIAFARSKSASAFGTNSRSWSVWSNHHAKFSSTLTGSVPNLALKSSVTQFRGIK